jgi:hypothetical protein
MPGYSLMRQIHRRQKREQFREVSRRSQRNGYAVTGHLFNGRLTRETDQR